MQMKKVIEFETRLAKFTEPDEDKRDEEKAYHIMSINELQNLAPSVRIHLSVLTHSSKQRFFAMPV